MSLLYRLKPRKDRALLPVCRALSSAGITPGMVTTAGLLFSVIAGLAAASGSLYAGVALFLLGACCDAVDGSLARLSGGSSEFGLYLDGVSDRLSESAFVAGAVFGGVSPAALTVVAGSVLVLASRIHNHRKGLDSDAALVGRPERLVLLVAGMLAPFPADVAVFSANALLCILSACLVLASGAGHRFGTGADRAG